MQLIYVDESGINYKYENNNFHDGPYILYGAMFIDDKKYFHLEKIFISIISEYFNIDDWRSHEIHASDIWAQKGSFSKYSLEKIRSFFEEIIQVTCKMNIKIRIGICRKSINAEENIRNNEIAKAMYCLLHAIEDTLSEKGDTGIIISDYSDIKQKDKVPLFSKLLQERIDWRFGKEAEKTFISKYKYESQSCFILDSIHYVDSKKSLFNQFVDVVLFVIKRVFTYSEIYNRDPTKAILEFVPITKTTFNYFAGRNLFTAHYNKTREDVMYSTEIYFHNSHMYNTDEFSCTTLAKII